MIEMYCQCGREMIVRESGLGWLRTCDCTGGGYWTTLAPLPKDNHVYKQLTGSYVKRIPCEVDCLYVYGV